MNAIPSKSADRKGSSESRAWVVRAGREGERVAHNLEHGVASIGWDEWVAPDLSSFADRNAYGEYIEQEFQHHTVSERASSRDQVWRFYHDISVGDLVVMPLKNHGTAEDWIAVGRVTGTAAYDPSQPYGAHHRRSVRWLASSVPKAAAPDDLQSSIVYERDPEARRICVQHHGAKCRVCGIDFGEEYGDFGAGFIHVHHKTPVARAAKDGEYKVDPKDDLVPVCPNCHAMLHRHPDKPCTVEMLKTIRESLQ